MEGNSDVCDVYQNITSDLPTSYTPALYTFIFDYKSLQSIVDIYGTLINSLFDASLFEYINTLYNAFKSGVPSFGVILGLMNIHIIYFVTIAVIITLLLAAVLTIVFKVLCRGSNPYQKISPWHGLTRSIYGVILFILTLFIMCLIMIGLVGAMHWQQSKIRYENFARDTSNYFGHYVANISGDMQNMVEFQFNTMLTVLEDDIYDYQMEAATAVRRIEEPYAMKYYDTADEMERQEGYIERGFKEILPSLKTIIKLASDKNSETVACYTGVQTFCEGPNKAFCDDIFNARNAAPIYDYALNWVPRDNFETSVNDYEIPTITKVNWKMWNETVQDLMDYNKPLRDKQKMHHQSFKSWMQKNIKLMKLIRKFWDQILKEALPTNDVSFVSTASLGLQTQVDLVRWLSFAVCISVLLAAITCLILFGVGLCVSDPEIDPTERSAMSHNIGTCMMLTSGFFSILLVVVLALTIPSFVVSSIVTQTCTETKSGKNVFWLWDNKTITDTSPISKALGIEHKDISFQGLLGDCKENKQMNLFLSLQDIWNIDSKFILGDFLDFRRVAEQSDLNPHEHWYSDFYSTTQRALLGEVVDITSNNFTGVDNEAPEEVVPYAHLERGLVMVPEEQLEDFRDKATAARNKYNIITQRTTWNQLNSCVNNINTADWTDLHKLLYKKFKNYREKVLEEELVSNLLKYRSNLLQLQEVELNKIMFSRSKSTYKRIMKEAVALIDIHVECYEDLVIQQYNELLGRCRPLYDIYIATFNFICNAMAPTGAIVTTAFILLSLTMVMYSLVLSLSVQFFQRMSVSHPDDAKQKERESVAQTKKTEETDL